MSTSSPASFDVIRHCRGRTLLGAVRASAAWRDVSGFCHSSAECRYSTAARISEAFHSGHASRSGKPHTPSRRPRATAATTSSCEPPVAQGQEPHRHLDRRQRVLLTGIDIVVVNSHRQYRIPPGAHRARHAPGKHQVSCAPLRKTFDRVPSPRGGRFIRVLSARLASVPVAPVSAQSSRRSCASRGSDGCSASIEPGNPHPESRHHQPASGPLPRDAAAAAALRLNQPAGAEPAAGAAAPRPKVWTPVADETSASDGSLATARRRYMRWMPRGPSGGFRLAVPPLGFTPVYPSASLVFVLQDLDRSVPVGPPRAAEGR